MTKRKGRTKKCGSVGATKEAGDDEARGVGSLFGYRLLKKALHNPYPRLRPTV